MNPKSASLLIAVLIHGALFWLLLWFVQQQSQLEGMKVEKTLSLSLNQNRGKGNNLQGPAPEQVRVKEKQTTQDGTRLKTQPTIIDLNKPALPAPIIKKPEALPAIEDVEVNHPDITVPGRINKTREEKVVAKQTEGEQRLSTQRSEIGKATQNVLEREYLNELRQRIGREKYYPRQSRRRSEEGVVKLSFILNRNGQLLEIKILESSGYQLLDQAALGAVKKASPFPPFPSGLSQQTWPITVPLSYTMR